MLMNFLHCLVATSILITSFDLINLIFIFSLFLIKSKTNLIYLFYTDWQSEFHNICKLVVPDSSKLH
jgi:hypothetical protein